MHYPLLVIVHIAFGALWFAGPLTAVSTLKRGLPMGREPFLLAARVANRGGMLAAVGNLGVLASGVALIFVAYGSMKALPVNFHVALGLVLIGTALGFGVLKPTGARIEADAEQESWTPAQAEKQIKKLAAVGGVSHLLWLGALTMMYAHRF